MSDENTNNSTPEAQQQEPVEMSFAKFLESMPPNDEFTTVTDMVERDDNNRVMLASPPIVLHCSHVACNGRRVYRYDEGSRYFPGKSPFLTYLTYLCSNCRRTTKVFSLLVDRDRAEEPAAQCVKFGEIPKFGPPTPNRLLRLFGSDSRVFLKGRQCENHGLGIGAFSYYRRVVERHKDQLFDEIIKVAAKIAPDTMDALQHAKEQHQFLNALESVKDVFPQGLLINGQNPLTLLHSALSEGLHARTDEECLQYAHDVRVVLAELAERMGQALKDEAELNAAVERLTKKRNTEAQPK